MRFDDTLRTVLRADVSTAFGAAAAWRQLVDLIGRNPAADSDEAIDRLRELRARVPVAVREASARALAGASPPDALVDLFLEDASTVAAPIVRSATLPDATWVAMLPRLTPVQRAMLRGRRDLDPGVTRALASFGSIDFALGTDRDAAERSANDPLPVAGAVEVSPPVSERDPQLEPQPAPEPVPTGPFRIADVVARIDAHRGGSEGRIERRSQRRAPRDVAAFRFETDAAGLIRWVDGADRAPLIGLAIGRASALAQSDGVVAGAFRQRAGFRDARLEIGGIAPVSGSWRISAVPVFEPRTGRFTGYRGTARRPRAEDAAHPSTIGADSLRQLVHELRTPANAIAGFAEMIDTQLLGPVPDVYRGYAAAIRHNIGDLLGAIDDLDLAARIEGDALALSPGRIAVRGVIERIVGDLGTLAAIRGAHILIEPGEAIVEADGRAVERLLARLAATVVGAAEAEEEIGIMIDAPGPDDRHARIAIDLPRALRGRTLETLCASDDEIADGALLGTGFAFRLIANLARELQGRFEVEADRLTVTLPAAVEAEIALTSSEEA